MSNARRKTGESFSQKDTTTKNLFSDKTLIDRIQQVNTDKSRIDCCKFCHFRGFGIAMQKLIALIAQVKLLLQGG